MLFNYPAPTVSAAQSSDFPLGKWLEADYTNNFLAGVGLSHLTLGDYSRKTEHFMFDLGNDGTSIAVFGRTLTGAAAVTVCHWNGASIVTATTTPAGFNRPIAVLQYIQDPKKFLVMASTGELSEWDFNGVEDASAGPTQTVLRTGLNVGSEAGPGMDAATFNMKWLGDNDDTFLSFTFNSASYYISTYQDTGSGFTRAGNVQGSFGAAFSPNRNACNWGQRKVDGDHYFVVGGSGNIRSYKVSINSSTLAPTLIGSSSSGSTVAHTFDIGEIVAWVSSGNQIGYPYLSSSTITWIFNNTADTEFSRLHETAPVRPHEALVGAYRFRVNSNGSENRWKLCLYSIGGWLEFPFDLHLRNGGIYHDVEGGLLFTHAPDQPYKYSWFMERHNTSDLSRVSLCAI